MCIFMPIFPLADFTRIAKVMSPLCSSSAQQTVM